MSFNVKKDKKQKKVKEDLKTVENIHDEMMKHFKNLRDIKLPVLQRKLLLNPLDTKIKKELDDIESNVEENDYFLSVNLILKEYFSISESNLIELEDMANVNKPSRRQQLTESYYEILGISYKKSNLEMYIGCDYCPECNIEMKITTEKFYTCTSCGIVNNYKLIDGLSYEERCINNQIFIFDYKRINYFTEWLTQIQANETTEIPHELLEDLKIELYKRNISDTSKLTNSKLKKILKEINRSKYYEHIPLIISKLCNSKPLNIPEEVCIELKKMFMLIQQPFQKLKGERKNFLSYPYILYKFCEILGLDQYLCHFMLLKSREKLLKTDVLWKSIVEELIRTTNDTKWRFIPSC